MEGVQDVLARLEGEGVVYAEVRLCPSLHTMEGLTEQQVGRHTKPDGVHTRWWMQCWRELLDSRVWRWVCCWWP